ncbi:sodium:calcium antiporter [Symbiobacterium thermophilum]|nr:sodium:calcium antiporter [Symbiobacterium thermophilum]
MNPWLIFAICAAVIIVAGRAISNASDELAERTGLGRAFIGSLLLAGATSLPEVAASGSAAFMGSGNLALGNVFGSNIFNMILLVVGQIFATRHILSNVSPTHITTAATGMLLSGIAALSILAPQPYAFLGAGLDTWLIAVLYIVIMRMLPGAEQEPEVAAATQARDAEPTTSLTVLWLKFAASAAAILVAGWFLSKAADEIAVITGLGQTFIGSTLLAASTSLPELTVSIFTARMGAYDLLVGNVLGSNIFNMVILIVSDLLQPGSTPILSTGTTGQAVSALVGLVLSGIVIVSLTLPRREGKFKFSWDMWLILAVYLVGLRMIYQAG